MEIHNIRRKLQINILTRRQTKYWINYLSNGELFQEICWLVGLPKLEFCVNCHFDTTVFSSNQGLEASEISRVGVQRLKQNMAVVGKSCVNLNITNWKLYFLLLRRLLQILKHIQIYLHQSPFYRLKKEVRSTSATAQWIDIWQKNPDVSAATGITWQNLIFEKKMVTKLI